jgi:hypothetical protein
MKKLVNLLFTLGLLVIASTPGLAGESYTKFGGAFYFDYFADFTDRPGTDQNPERGFELRRAYVTMKKSWGDVLFRATTDVDYEFGTDNLNVYSKYLYLQHGGLVKDAKLIVGQHNPYTLGWTEEKWAYRSMAKTVDDENHWSHPATFGVGLQGKLSDGMFAYYLDFNNGNGYKAPIRKDGIGFAARGVATPTDGLVLSALFTSNTEGTYDDVDGGGLPITSGSDEADTYFEGLAGFEQDKYRVYGQFGMFEEGATDVSASGLSVFGRYLLMEGTHAVARFDLVDPDTDTDDDGHNWILVGVDHELHEGYFIQPSFRIKNYQASGMESETEFVLTFFGKI